MGIGDLTGTGPNGVWGHDRIMPQRDRSARRALLPMPVPVSLPLPLPLPLPRQGFPLSLLLLAGLLAGYGTSLGGGCTSGHGVCGLARLAPRSLAATAVFMASAAATTYVVRHLLGLA